MTATQSPFSRETLAMMATVIVGLAFVGLIRGIRQESPEQYELGIPEKTSTAAHEKFASPDVIPATAYHEMRRSDTGPTATWTHRIEPIKTEFDFRNCVTCHEPHTLEIGPDPELKRASLKKRSERRAYNGAPPVVPHSVEQTNDAACMTCHLHGAQIGNLVANRMPHRPLTDCLQCHAPPAPTAFASRAAPVQNLFAGLATPFAGPRAYAGAPPLIPHSTWMRENCLSCHGGLGGWPGLEVTHRWRTNCLQCHGVSSELEQAFPINMPAGSTVGVP